MSERRFIEAHIESTDFPWEALRVRKLTGVEAISKPFELTLDLVAERDEGLDGALVPGAAASVRLSEHGSSTADLRLLHGIITSVEDGMETEAHHRSYRVTLGPRLLWLDMIHKQDIYRDMSVPEIAEQLLAKVGLTAGVDMELRLHERYPKRELVTQYKESDLAFLSRLCEHVGIAYFFEHDDARDKVVLTDHPGGFKPIEGDSEIRFRGRGEHMDISSLRRRMALKPQHYFVTDYNYRKPFVDLTASASIDHTGVLGGVVEYGAHTKDPSETEYLAKVRSEAANAERSKLMGKSDRPMLASGAKITLTGHDHLDDEGLLLVEVRHEASQPRHEGLGSEVAYQNSFVAVPARDGYRPPRVTPRPHIHGLLNAFIDGESPNQPKIDAEGRYYVRFAFDMEGRGSRPVRMVQPHAGAAYGMHFPLRPDVEVMIAFVDGDPDRPVIVGAVHDPAAPSPVTAQNHKINKLKSASGCLLEFFDGDE